MITIGLNKLDINDFEAVVFEHDTVSLDAGAHEQVRLNYEFLRTYSKDKVIYGINTGLGPMAQHRISEGDQLLLQYNLIRSHSAGSGNLFSEELSKATMLSRLCSLMMATSGIHPSVPELIVTMLNHGVYPCIYERGGVGASGDLVQLAHFALNLLGEGQVIYKGRVVATREVFEQLSIRPMEIHLREGLALMNGTSAMTGVAIHNIILVKYLLTCSIIMSSMINELMESFDDHFSHELNHAKLHPGQREVARRMRSLMSDSRMVRKRPDHMYNPGITEEVFSEKVQEYYSLRCVPQILGPIYETLSEVKEIVENELNSASDNPVIDHARQEVYHGGNFHGDYISLAMDKLKIAVVRLSMLSERQLNYLLNDKLNQKLPPFINLRTPGLNFGLQGLQFMATSTVAENQTLANPMYVHSIPCNNDNQDIVSMGCNSALLAARVIDNTFDILTIQLMALTQAVDFLKCQDRLSSSSLKVYETVRSITPVIEEDKPKYTDIQHVRRFLTELGRAEDIFQSSKVPA